MAVSRRRPWWHVLGVTLIRLVPIAFVIAMKSLIPENIEQVLALIFYGGLLTGTGYFLVFASRRPAPSGQKEAFRKPARIMAFGMLLLAAFALVLLTLTGPDSQPSAWVQAIWLTLLAGAILFLWRGTRQYSKEAAAHPGKHASPGNSRQSRWPRPRR